MRTVFFWVAFMLFGLVESFAQHLPSVFITPDKLQGSTTINHTVSDQHQQLWVASESGLIIYDSQFGKKIQHDILGNSPIYHVSVAADCAVLASTKQGLWKINVDQKIEQISSQLISKTVVANNKVYALAHDGIYILKSSGFEDISFAEEGTTYFDLVELNDTLWVATSKGLFKKLPVSGTVELVNNKIFTSIRKFGNLLLLHANKVIYSYNGSSLRTEFSWSGAEILDWVIDPVGMYWLINTDAELIKFDGINTYTYNKSNGVQLHEARSLYLSEEGILWVAGTPGIVSINTTLPFTFYNFESGLKLRTASSVHQANEMPLMVFSSQDLDMSQLKINKTFAKLHLATTQQWLFVFSGGNSIYLIDDKFILWRYTANGKLESIRQFTSSVATVFSDSEEGFILLSNGQLFKTLGNALSLFGTYTVDGTVAKACFDKGNLWILNNKGALSKYIASGGVELVQLDASVVIHDFQIKGSDTLYLATDKGLLLQSLSNKNWNYRIDDQNGLPSNLIRLVFVDSNKQIWLVSGLGLHKIELDQKSKQGLLINAIDTYTQQDGLLSIYIHQIKEDIDQNLWMVSEAGISHYDPLKEVPNLRKPSVKINEINIIKGAITENPKKYIRFHEGDTALIVQYNHQINIQAFALTHNRSNKSEIIYRLRQRDSWIEVPNNQVFTIQDLGTGTYTLEIKSRNAFGVESDTLLRLSITVLPPIWKEWWFYLVLSSAVIVIGFVSYKAMRSIKDSHSRDLQQKLTKELEDFERKSHQQILKTEKLKQLNELTRAQKEELESKNKEIEGQKYELALTNEQIKKQKDLIQETGNKLKASINYAQRIQGALMSSEIELKTNIDESFVLFRPRDVVSGDFFWFKKVFHPDDQRPILLFAAVDCTGHGVPGAIMSVVGINLLNNNVMLKGLLDPGEILTELNIDIRSVLRHDSTNVNDGMDMSICVIDQQQRTMKFAGAKNPLFYVENNEIITIKGDKNPIGGQQTEEKRFYTTHEFQLKEEKQMFYIFSDGYQDQFGGAKGYKFLSKNFRELLTQISDQHVIEQKTVLDETFVNWKAHHPQTDDVLVVGFRI